MSYFLEDFDQFLFIDFKMDVKKQGVVQQILRVLNHMEIEGMLREQGLV